MKGYCSVVDIENYLLTEVAEWFEPQVIKWIESMEAYIDKFTGRSFIADEEASAKKYELAFRITAPYFGTGNFSKRELYIDDCIEITKLTIDGEEIDSGDYLPYPINTLPIMRIKLTNDSGLVFTSGEQNIEVEARWGYSEVVPEDIKFACVVLVAGIINYSKSDPSDKDIRSEQIGNYSVSYGTESTTELSWQDFTKAMEILGQYKKITF